MLLAGSDSVCKFPSRAITRHPVTCFSRKELVYRTLPLCFAAAEATSELIAGGLGAKSATGLA